MSRSARWTVLTLLGLAVWIGATVLVAATSADPSDATPILRTFALGGGGFIVLVLLGAAAEIRWTRAGASERLYRHLALTEPSPSALRVAARRTGGTAAVYLGFTGLTSALLFVAIGLGESGPYRQLFLVLIVLVLIWAVYSIIARGRAYAGTGALLAPLGLAVTGTPTYVSNQVGGGGNLVGALTFAGQRHGRAVSIQHTTRLAVTEVQGQFPARSITSAATFASLTGEPAGTWRGVRARAGAEGVAVRRTGNGAGRWFLYDLLLAEGLAKGLAEGRAGELAEGLAGSTTDAASSPERALPDAPHAPGG